MANLANLSDLTLMLGVPDDDPFAALALRRASSRFIEAVGWPVIEQVAATITLRGDGGCHLQLPGMNVRDATARIGGEKVTDAALDPRLGLLTCKAGWPCGERVEVTFTAGWAEGEIPGGIQDAVLEQAAALHAAMVNKGASRVTRGPFTFEWQGGAGLGQVGATATWDEAVRAYRVGIGDWS